MAIAEFKNVSKSFNAKDKVIKALDFEIKKHDLVVLLGPNGAGKTTSLSLLMGLKKPDCGQVLINGLEPSSPKNRKLLGATPQSCDFPSVLKVYEVINLVRSHYDNPLPMNEIVKRFELQNILQRSMGGLSGGEKRKVAVALAFCGNPDLILLDEPSTALDVSARRQMIKQITEFHNLGKTILLTTHYLDEAEELARRVVVLHQGSKIFDGNIEQLKSRVGIKKVRFRSEKDYQSEYAFKVDKNKEWISLFTLDADRVVKELFETKHSFSDLEVFPINMEEAFLHLTETQI